MSNQAYDFITEEFRKLRLCKAGQIHTDINQRSQGFYKEERDHRKKEPVISKQRRDRIFSDNKEELLDILVLKDDFDLTRASLKSIHTEISVSRFKEKMRDLAKPDGYDEWQEERQRLSDRVQALRQEQADRISGMEADFKRVTLDFLSGTKAISDFQDTFDAFELKEW